MRCRLTHKPLPFLRSLEPHAERVRAFPSSWDDEGRMTRFGSFDTVLFSSPSPDAHEGLHRKISFNRATRLSVY